MKYPPGVSEEQEDEQVKCISVVGGRSQNLLLPVYCCAEMLLHKDNRILTFDPSETATHPAVEAILFQHLV